MSLADWFAAIPSWHGLMPFAFGVLILQLSPGPDMLLILNRGIVHGPRVAFSTVAGIVVIAGAIQVGLLALGLGTLVRAHPELVSVLQVAGAGYLLFLGIRMMTTRMSDPGGRDARPIRARTAVWEGTLNSLTNPKSFVFLFILVPQFADPQAGPVWVQLLVLGSIHKLAGLVTLSSVALAADRIGRLTRRWPRLLPLQRNVCGLAMVGIGLALASQLPRLI